MILNEIKSKLEEVESKVCYGMVDEALRDTVWDYIVFNRLSLKRSVNRTSYSDYIEVHIVRENFIPEGLDIQIIEKMHEIDGIRLADIDGRYDYIKKGATNTVVEMLTLTFVRARKYV